MPAVLDAMNGPFRKYDGSELPRLVQKIYDLGDAGQLAEFTRGETKTVLIPGTEESLPYDPLKRVGIGTSVLGTSEAVGIGAYAFALHELDGRA